MKETKFKVDYLSDTITEVVKKCNHVTLAIWATDCAEHVLAYFEEKQPNNLRPRNAIDDASTAAARTCGHAAATAHVATHAPHAATYAAKAVGYAKDEINEERTWQYNRLLVLFNNQHA